MVTIQEIISQRRGEVSAFEKQLQSQSELISEREAQLSAQERELIKETTPQAITVERQVSLAQRFGLGGVGEAVKGIRREKKAIREKALPQFKKAQEEIASARKQVISERARVAPIKAELTKAEQFERGRKLAQTGGLLFNEPSEVVRGFRSQKQASRISRQQIALRKIGEPLFIDGKLFGFEADRQTIPLESLSIERLESLQSAGILELQKAPRVSDQLFTPAPLPEPKRTFLGKTLDFLSGKEFIEIQAKGKVTSAGTTFDFGKGIVRDPIFEVGTPEFEAEVIKAEQSFRTGALLQSAIFLSFAGLKVKIPKATLKIPLREVEPPSFIEFQQPVITPSGKQKILSTFEITTELQAPSLVSTKEGGILFGKFAPAKLERTLTPFQTFLDTPTLTLTTRGGKVGKLDILSGVSRKVGAGEIGGLPKTQKFLAQRFAEDLAGGRPIKFEGLPKLFKQESQFDLGFLEARKLGRIDIGTAPTTLDILPLKTLGKRTTRFETFGRFEKKLTTDQFEVFTGKTFFKDITFEGARATGRTPDLPGIVIRAIKPIVLGGGDDLGVQIFRSTGAKRTPLSKTFGEQIQFQELKLLPKPLPKAKGRRPKISLKRDEPKQIGGITGLFGRGISGLDFGELSGVSRITSDFVRGFQDTFQPKGIAKAEKDPFSIGKFQPRVTGIEIFGLKGLGRQAPQLKDLGALGLDTKTLQKGFVGLRFDEKVIEKLSSKQAQKQLAREKLVSKQLSSFKPRVVRKPTARGVRPSRRGTPRIAPPIVLFPELRRFGEERKGKRKGKRKTTPIRVSFTGTVLNIKTPAQISETFGVLPGTIRGLETGKPKKKKSKKKKS